MGRVKVKSIGWFVVIAPLLLLGAVMLVWGVVDAIAPGGSDEVLYERTTRERGTGMQLGDKEVLSERQLAKERRWDRLGGGIAIVAIMAFALTQKAISIAPKTAAAADPGRPPQG